MVIIKLQGGLGNQMFQYAFAKALAEVNDEELLVDDSFYKQEIGNVDKRTLELGLFPSIKIRYASRWLASSFYQYSRWDNRLRKLLGFKKRNLIREENFRYHESYLKTAFPVLLDGLFQTERYFCDQRELIHKIFQFPSFSEQDPNRSYLQKIESSNSVSVHVRRGDYVKFAVTQSFHGTCSTAYYRNAIQYFRDRIPDCKFFFFSDEPDWVKENLSFEGINSAIVSLNKGTDSWKDMRLMSCCKHNVVANSSFSWWGAWLNKQEGKEVIVPAQWFRTTDPFFDTTDLVPGSWMKLPND
ncbi:MAG: alpha-1,2-fucosyltransferase [Puia sp.]|nr:alpha-1,2-fucosyltransferase [Puia sp.]